jgi:copper chaperone
VRKLISIGGMSCGHCAMKIKSALLAVKGVSFVEVDLLRARAMVEGDELYNPALRAAVASAGYRPGGVV